MDVREVDRQTGEVRPPCGLRETGRWLCQQLRTTEDWGYFGPSSTMWALHREACLGVGLGRALLLQLAHPWVAQAVVDHSAVRDQPLDRLVRTVVAAELLVFGSCRQADAVAALERYMGAMIGRGTVAVGPAAREVATALLHVPVLPSLSWRAYSALTRAVAVAMLPEELRAAYGPAFAPRPPPLHWAGGALA